MKFLANVKEHVPKEKDSAEIFGMLVSSALRKLSPTQQIMAKQQIQNIIYNIQLQPENPPHFFFFFFSIWLDDPHLTNEHRTQDCIAS